MDINISGGLSSLGTVTEDDGDLQKVLAMLVLGLGSLIFGMIPAFISERNRQRFPLTTSLMLCFGAGILLATALVHILPEVREAMQSKFAEVTLCGGFFIIYFIDEFIHYFFGEAIQHSHAPAAGSGHSHTGQNRSSNAYGAVSERTPLMNAEHQPTAPPHSQQNGDNAHNHEHDQHAHTSADHSCNDASVEDANARICHTSHTEPCAQSMTGTLGLFVALSLHSAIEGLAIGVQNSSTKVLFLLGAVACHKFVMGFCLGLEFRSTPRATMRSQFIGIMVFALGAVCGIGLGMLIVHSPQYMNKTTLAIIQALAGGTLFYVTVCEVIPREKARWHRNAERRCAGFAQFITVFAGFATMCIINYYLADDD
ncbi:zinc transporter ZIP1 [Drosophila busckii]|uniref:zinc transporter ZIP1 n=1 Tax=Drosophila busckii TaxID=30019 RepID=UPI00083F17BF|nr:zinc transporter ZIP1 [Drosophila busckii]